MKNFFFTPIFFWQSSDPPLSTPVCVGMCACVCACVRVCACVFTPLLLRVRSHVPSLIIQKFFCKGAVS